ncbi:MAG: methyltransferase domain-containing protein [Pseudonocardiaceae bacterium]
MDEQRAEELIAGGDLTLDWRPSFLAVPRLQFIPDTVWHEVDGLFRPVRRTEDPDSWLELAGSKDSVVTQVDDGCPAGPGEAGDTPTSSASMPTMVALMLKYLDVHGGERVLEIGTGTGYNAALLAHRVGAGRVVTIEIDPEVAAQARKALSDAGFGGVTTVVGNGSLGHPSEAPYDRVIATASCHTVPYAWVAQTRPGGRIVTPWGSQYCNFGLLALSVNDDGTATGRIVDTAAFMRLRDQRFRSRPISPTDEDEKQAMADYGSSDSGASLGDILGPAIKERQEQQEQQEQNQDSGG